MRSKIKLFHFLPVFDLTENHVINTFVSNLQSDPTHTKRSNLQKRTYADCVRFNFPIFFSYPFYFSPNSNIQIRTSKFEERTDPQNET